jgi:hypothetical protein
MAYAGSAYDLDQVSAEIEGLEPSTSYHYRVVAENDAGITIGADRVFSTLAVEPVSLPPSDDPVPEPAVEPDPQFGETVVADGDGVRFKEPGGTWQDLARNAELPVGVALDARNGKVNLRSAGCRGGIQAGTFGGGVFSIRQPRKACGRVDVYLQGGNFAHCAQASGHPASRQASLSASASGSRRVRRLWGRDSGGSFRSHGRHSHATVRGTRWLTEDRCDGTLTRVTNGSVVVRDFGRQRNIVVRAGHSYLAKAHPRHR